MSRIFFLCGGHDFHAMDWYFSAKKKYNNNGIGIVTDIISSEGYKKLIDESDNVYRLFIIDNLLFKSQSHIGNIWRNIIKLLIFPLQVLKLKQFIKDHPDSVFHAHSMYYIWLAWAAGVEFVGTPQGSDILIKPFKSKLYKHFAIKSMRAAKSITVDSVAMKSTIKSFSGVEAVIIQNGIDMDAIFNYRMSNPEYLSYKRNLLLSIRAITPLYRILELFNQREKNKLNINIMLIYPFQEGEYKVEVNKYLKSNDVDLGRVDRERMYELLHKSGLVVSIPSSDSSPRSVYEAIFCGAPVAITYHPYYDTLPKEMQERIILIDLKQDNWLEFCLDRSKEILKNPFLPSQKTIDLFNQNKSFETIENLLLS